MPNYNKLIYTRAEADALLALEVMGLGGHTLGS
jgi:hypothetical protein